MRAMILAAAVLCASASETQAQWRYEAEEVERSPMTDSVTSVTPAQAASKHQRIKRQDAYFWLRVTCTRGGSPMLRVHVAIIENHPPPWGMARTSAFSIRWRFDQKPATEWGRWTFTGSEARKVIKADGMLKDLMNSGKVLMEIDGGAGSYIEEISLHGSTSAIRRLSCVP